MNKKWVCETQSKLLLWKDLELNISMELNDSSISYLANLILVVKQQRSDDVSALAALRRIHFMVYVPYILQNILFL